LYQSNEIHVKDTVTCKLRDRVKYVVADRSRGRERKKNVFARGSVDGEESNRGWAGRVLYQSNEIEIEDRVASELRHRVRGKGRVKYVEKVINTRGSVDGEGQDRGQTVGVLYQSNQIDVQNRLTCQQGERGTDSCYDRVPYCDSSAARVRIRIRIGIGITDSSPDRQKNASAGRSVDIQGRDGGVGVFF
jgi:hypothetical protein